MTTKPLGNDEDDIPYRRPEDVPPDLDPLARARIAARNVRAWADWLLETGPSPPQSSGLTDIGPQKGEG